MGARRGTVTALWKARKGLWRYRVAFFGPVTSKLRSLTTSRRLEQVIVEYKSWLASQEQSIVGVTYAADVWAHEVERMASSDAESSLMHTHGPILQSLARSARRFEEAAMRLAVEQKGDGDTQAAGAEMQVAFQSMALALHELTAAVVAKMPTEGAIDHLADEDERGNAVSTLSPTSSNPAGSAQSGVIPVRLDPELEAALRARMESEPSDASEVINDALRAWLSST